MTNPIEIYQAEDGSTQVEVRLKMKAFGFHKLKWRRFLKPQQIILVYI
ncbi:hypothetical protein CHY23_01516 [Actinobacillus pleuropneumoniae]|nr:hypothetical protein CHY23_01516 [Actinobacillus pleuropneumoniae]